MIPQRKRRSDSEVRDVDNGGKSKHRPAEASPEHRPAADAPTGNSGGNRGSRRGRPENLRPFKPGQSGNVSGRPKGAAGFAERIRQATKEGQNIVTWALAIARNPKAKDRMAAVKWLAHRGGGK